MRCKPYSEARRKQYVQLGADELVRIAGRLGDAHLKELSKYLPPGKLTGFRKGHRLVVMSQIKRLSAELSKDLHSDKKWKSAEILFVKWVCHVPKPHSRLPSLDELLNEFDNEADFNGDEEHVEPNSELDLECFRYLARKSDEFLIDRETIQDFYKLGYFLSDPRIEELIQRCRPLREIINAVEMEERLCSLEDRLDPMEDHTNDVLELVSDREKELQALSERLATSQQNIENLNNRLNSLKQSDSNTSAQVLDLKSSTAERLKRLEDQQQSILQTVTSLEERLKEVTACPVVAPEEREVAEARETPEGQAEPASTKPCYPNEGLFLDELKHQLWSGSAPAASEPKIGVLYSTLFTFPFMVCSTNGLADAISAAISGKSGTAKFVTESGWFQPEWKPELKEAHPEYHKILKQQGGIGTPEDFLVIEFVDYDRCFPELYLFSSLRIVSGRVHSNGSLSPILFVGVPCQDDVHVKVSAEFLRYSFDLSFLLEGTSVTDAAREESICRYPTDLANQNILGRIEKGWEEGGKLFEVVRQSLKDFGKAAHFCNEKLSRRWLALSGDLISSEQALLFLACGHIVPIMKREGIVQERIEKFLLSLGADLDFIRALSRKQNTSQEDETLVVEPKQERRA